VWINRAKLQAERELMQTYYQRESGLFPLQVWRQITMLVRLRTLLKPLTQLVAHLPIVGW